ncbi:MAG TPA: hypothetical protein VI544_02245 [Candidatus Nanoarchaeia archaeon]|nr:hypothetical protein [Candidatus Nanoarchaeia archaeon]
MAKKRMDFWMIAAFVLGLLFLSAVVYISVSKYKQSRDAEKESIFQQGAQYGYQAAVVQIIQNAKGCNPVDVNFENETLWLIDTSCLVK